MKILLSAILMITITSCNLFSQKVNYDQYFTEDRLRVDFILSGNSGEQQAYLHNLRKECAWAGSRKSLIDPFRYGEYMFEAFDGEKLVYSKGFNTLFQEWRTTAEAKEVSKAFTQTVWMPFPKKELRIVLSERVKATGKFSEMFSCNVNPEDKLITREVEKKFNTKQLLKSGPMEKKVDLIFVAEGYTAEQMDKFHKDCERFMNYMFTMEPYKGRKSDFNIVAVDALSDDSGTDIPHAGVWKRTPMDSHFYTFYIDRYLTISNHSKIASCVSDVPFDALFVVVNDEKYGGGGIYNSYGMGTADNRLSLKVFIHEFGHSFAGLADEYYTSDVAYEDFYNLKTEPWEPNITTLVDFGSKWKDMMEAKTPVPTPATKDFAEKVGVFEGGGYMAKGIYRPAYNCRMNTNEAKGFCPVCQRAISRMIDFYCK